MNGRNGSPSSRPGIDSNPGLGVTCLKFLCADIQGWYRASQPPSSVSIMVWKKQREGQAVALD